MCIFHMVFFFNVYSTTSYCLFYVYTSAWRGIDSIISLITIAYCLLFPHFLFSPFFWNHSRSDLKFLIFHSLSDCLAFCRDFSKLIPFFYISITGTWSIYIMIPTHPFLLLTCRMYIFKSWINKLIFSIDV
jgi:hypothetical protein